MREIKRKKMIIVVRKTQYLSCTNNTNHVKNFMTVDTIIELLKKILDISLVWALLYFVLKSMRHNIKQLLIFKGIIIIILIKIFAHLLDLATIEYLINYVIEWSPIALIIIFQPEIRSALEQLGKAKLLGRHKTLTLTEKEQTIREILVSLANLRKQKMGALIIIERDESLENYISKAQKIYAKVSSPLLTAIFFVNNPLHDGGVIIQGDQISCSNAIFPTSDSLSLSKRLGTRHRAALGIAEVTDCLAIVLSEETGRISLAIDGQLLYNISFDELKLRLLNALTPGKKTNIRTGGDN